MLSFLLFIFIGCSKDTTKVEYLLQRDGSLVVDRVVDIVNKYKLTNSHIKEYNSSYEIGFQIKLVDAKTSGDGIRPPLTSVNIDLCKNKQVTNRDVKNNKLEENLFNQGNEYVLYLSLDKMLNKGLLSSKKTLQEDICIYVNSDIDTYIDKHTILKSNTLVFKADEINAIRDEYKSLTQ